MGFIGHHDDVGAGGQHRVGFAHVAAKFLDEREHIALVPGQQFLQVRGAVGLHFGAAGRAGIGKRLVDLGIEFVAVGPSMAGASSSSPSPADTSQSLKQMDFSVV